MKRGGKGREEEKKKGFQYNSRGQGYYKGRRVIFASNCT